MKRGSLFLGVAVVLALAMSGCGPKAVSKPATPQRSGAAATPAAAPVQNGQKWSPRAVLTLSDKPDTMSPLVADAGRHYELATIGGKLQLLSDAGGKWQAYGTGIGDYTGNSGEGYYGLAEHGGVVYVPYIDNQNPADLRLAFDPSGPSGPWSKTTMVPAGSASCGPGVQTSAPAAAVVGKILAVAFQASPSCQATLSHILDVYVATAPLADLTAGGSPAWQVTDVTLNYTDSASYPALAADGQALDLAYMKADGPIVYLVRGQPNASSGFTWPSKPQVLASVSNDGMDRPKLSLASGGPAVGANALALYAGGNVSDVWAATNAGGSWSASNLFQNSGNGNERPSAAVATCGPAVAYDVKASGVSAAQVTVAEFSDGRWNTRPVGPAEQSLDATWPGLAAIPGGFDLTYVNDDSGSAVLYLASGTCGFAVVVTVDSNDAQVGGRQEPIPVPAQIQGRRTFVPLRFVSEALGAKVSWNGATRQVTISQNGHTVVMAEGQTGYTVNGGAHTMDVAPYVAGAGYTMVPVRFVSEALGYRVRWNGATQQVTVTH